MSPASKKIVVTLAAAPLMLAVATAVRAEYKCDAPSNRIDRAACEKAKESPSALRQYVQRMRAITSLYFPDYVNEAQARAWEASRLKQLQPLTPTQTAQHAGQKPGS
jgi:hypothetical protein